MNGCSSKADIDTSAEQEKIAQEKANLKKLAEEKLAKEKAEAEAEAEAKLEQEKANLKAKKEAEAKRLAQSIKDAQRLDEEKAEANKVIAIKSAETSIEAVKNTQISTGSADVNDETKERLHSVVVFLKKYPASSVIVNTYTDSTGSEEFNLNLSQERADNIKNFLVSKGVSKNQVTSIGHGENNFIDAEDTTNLENRRIELELNSN